ncbi:uncharacterized protein LOC114712731 [Neltuma alba]|uniref:uncharacterized protein LOC114712731 n=1 Tax=Neltuma alba TaxID=207710 RepID=UPI0010A52904|nr:uncharacterized protein LOC114712731 [Prosopis alba]
MPWAYPVDFLKQLRKLQLVDVKLEAQSLKQLETLDIRECLKLKYIVAETMDDQDPNQKSHDSMLPKLKYLMIYDCAELEFILPICFCEDLPLLEIISKCKSRRSSSLSRGHLCCFWAKSKASTIRHTSAPMDTQSNHNQAVKGKYVVNRAHGLFTPPLYPCRSLRRIRIVGFSELKSLFTPSIVSSLKLLEWLAVGNCDALEHIVTDEEHGHDRGNANSIFPNLQKVEVYGCSRLEYIFPALYSKDLKHLESVNIDGAGMLTHVFGECRADENPNVQP